MVLSNLQPNSTYEIRRWEVSHRNDTYVLKSSDFSTVTMPTFSDRLLPIPSFKLVNVTTFGASYGAIVSWTPAAGKFDLNRLKFLLSFLVTHLQICLVVIDWMRLVLQLLNKFLMTHAIW